jgi:hypothetical protein
MTAHDLNDRKYQTQVDMTRRMQDAQELMVDVLRDKPELPPEISYRERSPKRKTSSRDTSPVKTRKWSPDRRDISPRSLFSGRDTSPRRKTMGQYKSTVTISPKVTRKHYQSDYTMEDRDTHQISPARERQLRPKPILVQPAPQPIFVQPAPQEVVPRLRLIDSDEFLRRSHETTGNISFLVQSPHYIELQNVVSLDMRACPIQNKIIGPFKIDSTRFNCIYFKA